MKPSICAGAGRAREGYREGTGRAQREVRRGCRKDAERAHTECGEGAERGAEHAESAELHFLRECHQDSAQVQRQQPLRAAAAYLTLTRAASRAARAATRAAARAATRRGRAQFFEAGRANQLLRERIEPKLGRRWRVWVTDEGETHGQVQS